MSDDNIIHAEFPKLAETQVRGLTLSETANLAAAAFSRMNAPVMGCLLLFWDADGVMSVSDNRGQSFTPEQLQWLTFGVAHLKGRGVINPTAQDGNVMPLAPPEGA